MTSGLQYGSDLTVPCPHREKATENSAFAS